MQAPKVAKLSMESQILPTDVLIHMFKLSMITWGMSVVGKAAQLCAGWRFTAQLLLHQLVQETVFAGIPATLSNSLSNSFPELIPYVRAFDLVAAHLCVNPHILLRNCRIPYPIDTSHTVPFDVAGAKHHLEHQRALVSDIAGAAQAVWCRHWLIHTCTEVPFLLLRHIEGKPLPPLFQAWGTSLDYDALTRECSYSWDVAGHLTSLKRASADDTERRARRDELGKLARRTLFHPATSLRSTHLDETICSEDMVSCVIFNTDYSGYVELQSYTRYTFAANLCYDRIGFHHRVVTLRFNGSSQAADVLIGPSSLWPQSSGASDNLAKFPYESESVEHFVNLDALDRLRSSLGVVPKVEFKDLCAFIGAATTFTSSYPFKKIPPPSTLRTYEERLNGDVARYLIAPHVEEKLHFLDYLISYAEGLKIKIQLCRAVLESLPPYAGTSQLLPQIGAGDWSESDDPGSDDSGSDDSGNDDSGSDDSGNDDSGSDGERRGLQDDSVLARLNPHRFSFFRHWESTELRQELISFVNSLAPVSCLTLMTSGITLEGNLAPCTAVLMWFAAYTPSSNIFLRGEFRTATPMNESSAIIGVNEFPTPLHQNQSSTSLDGREVPVLKLDPPLSALVGTATTTLTEQILTELLLFLIGLWPFVAAYNSKKRCYVLQSSWNEAFLRMSLEATELVSRALGFSEVLANAIFEHKPAQ